MIDAQIDASTLKAMSPDELRSLASKLLERIDTDAKEIHWRGAKIEKLTFEMAQLRRVRLGLRASNSTLVKRGCLKKPSMKTWLRWKPS